MVAGVVLGYNFGDGHFHNEQLLEAVQERCEFAAGELRVVMIESQPAHVQHQHYRIHDAAEGLIEEGYVNVADMVKRQPWLGESGAFPVEVISTVSEAIVVGSGPNGLVCAAWLARAGMRVTVLEARERIGGGTTTSELTLPGLLHDDCSAVHVMAVGAPSLNGLGLERHGLRVVLARGRSRAPARRWQRRGDAALDRGHAREDSARTGGHGSASSGPPRGDSGR